MQAQRRPLEVDDGRTCEACHGPLLRNIYPSQPEPRAMWKRRRFCSCYCRTTLAGAYRPGVVRWRVEDRGYVTPCHIWTGVLTDEGYGRFKRGSIDVVAHRAIYAERVGPIPDDHDLHHRCEQKACVRLDHLEPMTVSEHCSYHKPWLYSR